MTLFSVLALLWHSLFFAQYVAVPFNKGAPAAISYVTSTVGYNGSCSSNPSVSLSVIAGDTLVVAQGLGSLQASFIGTPTVSGGDTAALIGSKQNSMWTGGSPALGIWEVAKVGTTNASYTITANLNTTGSSCNLTVMQFRGSSAGTIDQIGYNTMGNSGLSTSTCVPSTNSNTTCNQTLTPGMAGEAAVLYVFNAASPTAGTMFGSTATLPSATYASGVGPMEYLLNIGTTAGTGTMGFGNDQVNAMMFTIEP